MLRFMRPALLATLLCAAAAAQPALTTIQDTLYRADGSRFNGMVYLTYTSFESGDQVNIATANLTLPVVNGALKVRLTPTTTASAGARYTVRYNSRGNSDFTELWAVPPSNITLRVRDVRVTTGTVVGPQPVLAPVQIPDVVGLQNELAVRTMKGVGFGPGRAAVINDAGQIDAATGALGNCVRVDGSSGPCSGTVPGFADNEVPAGGINGANLVFALTNAPAPANSLQLYRNGVLLRAGLDFVLAGSQIQFFLASGPQTGDVLTASYRYGDASNPLSSMAAPQVVCSSLGGSTSALIATSLGTCTLPADVLTPGDELGIMAQFAHVGSTAGFAAEIHLGGSTVLLRSVGAGESILAAETKAGVYSGDQIWASSSFGAASAQATMAGIATNSLTQPITVSFLGNLTGAAADQVILRNFTVVRYPAQSRP